MKEKVIKEETIRIDEVGTIYINGEILEEN